MHPDWEDFLMDDFARGSGISFGTGSADVTNVQLELYSADLDLPSLPTDFGNSTSGLTPILMQTEEPHTTDILSLTSPVPRPPRNILEEYTDDLADVDARTIRLLLNQYAERLVPALAPAQAQPRSLWELVHIPKVHETLGEIMIKGDASDSRVALFFAILSAASFHLDNTGLTSYQHNRMPWRKMGEIYRQRAKVRLVSSLKTISTRRGRENYKDMLLALLSMVTICVSFP
jgi:hypothetical protein